jgi:hypothetical protein
MVDFECGDFPLLLGREGEFRATANKEEILEVGHLLKAIADFELEAKQEVSNSEAQAEKRKESTLLKDSYSKTTTCLKKLVEILGFVLDWFDESCSITGNYGETKGTVDGNKPENTPDYQKNESVLRGLYHIIGIVLYLLKIEESHSYELEKCLKLGLSNQGSASTNKVHNTEGDK